MPEPTEGVLYTISVGGGLAIGAIFDTRESAELTAKRMKLTYYEVIPHFRDAVAVTKNV